MPVYELNQMHLANVLGLSVPERYSYLVKRFADWEQCYGLRSEAGWAAAGDDNGNEFIPIWPHERFAQLCMEGYWADCQPVVITLDEWFEKLRPYLQKKRLGLAVFPLPQGGGVTVDLERFTADLEEELSKIDGE